MAYQPTYVGGNVPEPRASSKRIIVCCDGTWDDGLILKERWKYTNVLRLARTFDHFDHRVNPPIPQIVFYQSGVGTDDTSLLSKIEGAVGAHLASKVQDAYGFIAHNYTPGDEIFLFGFSRGAYTARMVASMIGAIGVLDRTEMDHFASIFVDFQKRGKATDPAEIAHYDAKLHPWTQHDSPGKRRADSGPHSFSIKCVGVFDTVGSLGLPTELVHDPKMKSLFGFPNSALGEHIERAYHAMALNETREDFNVCKFQQTEGGRHKGQILRQVWFTGSHSDIGGGWQQHDLSDITLFWMAANIKDMLSLDDHYLKNLPDPVAPWGELPPHNPRTGIMRFTDTITRTLPTSTNDITHEKIHSSVLKQSHLTAPVKHVIDNDPRLICDLLPFERDEMEHWPYVPGKHKPFMPQSGGGDDRAQMVLASVLDKGKEIGKELLHKVHHSSEHSSEPTVDPGLHGPDENGIGRMAEESNIGPIYKALRS